jgi:hypothetical protein
MLRLGQTGSLPTELPRARAAKSSYRLQLPARTWSASGVVQQRTVRKRPLAGDFRGLVGPNGRYPRISRFRLQSTWCRDHFDQWQHSQITRRRTKQPQPETNLQANQERAGESGLLLTARLLAVSVLVSRAALRDVPKGACRVE